MVPLSFVRVSHLLMCRMLEQLRKQQGSALHPDYSNPFRSFEDSLHRLLPYHLYQGTTSSQHDYQKGNPLTHHTLPFDLAGLLINPLNMSRGTIMVVLPFTLIISLVDGEFESVSCQLLKRTQTMLDKYRHLLFEESKVAVFIEPGHVPFLCDLRLRGCYLVNC